MQRGVAQRRNVNQRHITMGRVQRQGKVYGRGGGSAAALGIDHGKNFPPRSIAIDFPLRRGQPYESFEQVRGGGGTFDEFARTRSAWR